MDDIEGLLKTTVAELDKLLNARNVLGDPIEREGATIIPMVSFGFAFGAGRGGSETAGSDRNSGGGAGAGGGIRPLGAIIVDRDGARVEGMQGPISEILRTIGAAAGSAIDRAAENWRRSPGPGPDAPATGARPAEIDPGEGVQPGPK